jgi:hypothetical protein
MLWHLAAARAIGSLVEGCSSRCSFPRGSPSSTTGRLSSEIHLGLLYVASPHPRTARHHSPARTASSRLQQAQADLLFTIAIALRAVAEPQPAAWHGLAWPASWLGGQASSILTTRRQRRQQQEQQQELQRGPTTDSLPSPHRAVKISSASRHRSL